MIVSDLTFEKGLPANLEAERFVLGSVLLNDAAFLEVAGQLRHEDFSLEAHRRIFLRMSELQERGEKIDRLTLCHELMKHGQLESCGGVSYISALDDGLPTIANLDSYIRIVRDNSLLRRLIFTSKNVIERCLAGGEPADEILTSAEEHLLRLGETRTREALRSPREIIDNFEGGLNAFLDPSKRLRGLSTGFLKFDEKTGGLHPGELIIIAARPSMGKTALALNIAQHVAVKLKKTVAIFSLEMSQDSLLTRMLCAAARVDSQKFRAGFLNQHERRQLAAAAQQLVEAPLFIDDSGGVTLLDLRLKLRRLQAEHGLGLVVVDYLQLMSGKGENKVQEVSYLSRGLKILAKELNTPMLVLSQLSRAPENRQGDHRPQLSDLRDSGSIEQDADLVAFIFREEVYKENRADLRGQAELIIGKQRNGPTGKVNLTFLHYCTKFENRTSDLEDAGAAEVPPVADESEPEEPPF